MNWVVIDSETFSQIIERSWPNKAGYVRNFLPLKPHSTLKNLQNTSPDTQKTHHIILLSIDEAQQYRKNRDAIA
jgi:hypothetical protein